MFKDSRVVSSLIDVLGGAISSFFFLRYGPQIKKRFNKKKAATSEVAAILDESDKSREAYLKAWDRDEKTIRYLYDKIEKYQAKQQNLMEIVENLQQKHEEDRKIIVSLEFQREVPKGKKQSDPVG